MLKVKDLEHDVWYWCSKGYHFKFDKITHQEYEDGEGIIWMSEFVQELTEKEHYKGTSLQDQIDEYFTIRLSTLKELSYWDISDYTIPLSNVTSVIASNGVLDNYLNKNNSIKEMFIW